MGILLERASSNKVPNKAGRDETCNGDPTGAAPLPEVPKETGIGKHPGPMPWGKGSMRPMPQKNGRPGSARSPEGKYGTPGSARSSSLGKVLTGQ